MQTTRVGGDPIFEIFWENNYLMLFMGQVRLNKVN